MSMSYKPRSLFTLIEDVNRSIFLPHIQRPFVWENTSRSGPRQVRRRP
jgi:ribosome-associated toxin RatA of RatAB toxin-antitoxin module